MLVKIAWAPLANLIGKGLTKFAPALGESAIKAFSRNAANYAIKGAASGAISGGLVGGATAKEGEGVKGALKGGLFGGAIGAIGGGVMGLRKPINVPNSVLQNIPKKTLGFSNVIEGQVV